MPSLPYGPSTERTGLHISVFQIGLKGYSFNITAKTVLWLIFYIACYERFNMFVFSAIFLNSKICSNCRFYILLLVAGVKGNFKLTSALSLSGWSFNLSASSDSHLRHSSDRTLISCFFPRQFVTDLLVRRCISATEMVLNTTRGQNYRNHQLVVTPKEIGPFYFRDYPPNEPPPFLLIVGL